MSEEKQSLQEFKERVIALIDAEIAKLKDVPPPVTVYEEGKWYKSPNGLLIYSKDEKNCTGFWRGKWNTGFTFEDYAGKFVPATSEDIKDALVKEAEKRGFKAGDNITRKFYLSNHPTKIDGGRTTRNYYFDEDELTLNSVFIYKGGIWAEIVKEQPLMIGGKEVVYQGYKLNEVITGAETVLDKRVCFIDNHKYHYREIFSLCVFMKDHSSQVKSLNVGCDGQYKVTLEMLEQIIKGFK